MIYRVLLACLLATTLMSAASAEIRAAPRLSAHEGFVQVPGGYVWYRVFGSGSKTPLLIVHGGPGDSSCFYEPLAMLLGKDRPVVVYDQLGSGRSGRPMNPTLWRIDRSIQELAAVREALGLARVHLMGHSWGGALAVAYILDTQLSGVDSLVLAGPLISTKVWLNDANILRRRLPQDVQAILQRNEQTGTTHSREYRRATEIFYNRFLYHRRPRVRAPDSCAESPGNDEIYELMWGPTEFNATGNLLNLDLAPRLNELKMPVSFFIGRYDEARLDTVKRFQAMIPGSTIKIFEKSGHMAPLEESQSYAGALEEFLQKVDQHMAP